jgi:hypothetical protein
LRWKKKKNKPNRTRHANAQNPKELGAGRLRVSESEARLQQRLLLHERVPDQAGERVRGEHGADVQDRRHGQHALDDQGTRRGDSAVAGARESGASREPIARHPRSRVQGRDGSGGALLSKVFGVLSSREAGESTRQRVL